MTYTKEQKKKIYETLPEDLREAIISIETFEKIQQISAKYSLMLDEASELSDEIGLLILGLTKQNDFVGNISKRLGVSMSTAESITRDINTEIFDSIKDSLRKLQSEQEAEVPEEKEPSTPIYRDVQPISIPIPTPVIPIKPIPKSIEEAGEFTIEKPVTSHTPSQYNETNPSREDILKSIEDENIPLVDHLLTTPVNNAQKPKEKIIEKLETNTNPPEIKRSAPGIDPYREQI